MLSCDLKVPRSEAGGFLANRWEAPRCTDKVSVGWLWNHCLAVMTETYKTTGQGVSAFTMKKQIPLLKAE